MSPSDAIALKAAEFIRECRANSLTWSDIREIVAATYSEYVEAEHGSPVQDFLALIRRQQVINKVSTTCERLRRGESLNHQEAETKGKAD